MKVIEFLNGFGDRDFNSVAVFLFSFNKEYVPLGWNDLLELANLPITDEDDSEWAQGFRLTCEQELFVVIEDELHYLRRKVKEQAVSIKNLRDSLDSLRGQLEDIRSSVTADVIHQFMPNGFKGERYLSSHNKTPYRRGIANALFFLSKRGYPIPDDCVPFMERYKTRKTIRRKSK